jgi:hypothetical protein
MIFTDVPPTRNGEDGSTVGTSSPGIGGRPSQNNGGWHRGPSLPGFFTPPSSPSPTALAAPPRSACGLSPRSSSSALSRSSTHTSLKLFSCQPARQKRLTKSFAAARWDTWRELKLSSKRPAAASSLSSRRNSTLCIRAEKLMLRMNWLGTSEPSSDPRYRNSEPTG